MDAPAPSDPSTPSTPYLYALPTSPTYQTSYTFEELRLIAHESILASELSAKTGQPIPMETIERYAHAFTPFLLYGLVDLLDRLLSKNPGFVRILPEDPTTH